VNFLLVGAVEKQVSMSVIRIRKVLFESPLELVKTVRFDIKCSLIPAPIPRLDPVTSVKFFISMQLPVNRNLERNQGS